MHQDNYKLESGQVIWDKSGNPQIITHIKTDFVNPCAPSYGVILRCENLTTITGNGVGFSKNGGLVGQRYLFEEDFVKIQT